MDIVFQLLLFFILTSAFLDPALPLELPDSSRENKQSEADMLISIDAEGRIFLNGAPVSLEAVEQAVSALARENSAAGIVLQGDKKVQYGRLFKVLDIIQHAGITTISLAYAKQDP
jgi:biopolymer transport protein ExbD